MVESFLVEPYLYSVVGVQKQVPAADAAVDTAHGHVDAEGEEVAMVEMAHAVIQPGWKELSSICATSGTSGDTKTKSEQNKSHFHEFFLAQRIRQW